MVESKCPRQAGAAMSFDRLAPGYRAMEAVLAGGLLQRCRTAYLSEAGGRKRALLLGEGPGRFLVELLKVNPAIEVVCVEGSSRMILEAKRRLRRAGYSPDAVVFLHGDALDWRAGGRSFDLIASHFFLDCFRPEELERLIPRVAEGAARDARWLVADFCVPDAGWRRWRAKLIHAAMYAFFRRATGLSATRLTPPDGFLEAVGFRLGQRSRFNLGLLQSDVWVKGPD